MVVTAIFEGVAAGAILAAAGQMWRWMRKVDGRLDRIERLDRQADRRLDRIEAKIDVANGK